MFCSSCQELEHPCDFSSFVLKADLASYLQDGAELVEA